MKKMLIIKTPPKAPVSDGKVITAQRIGDQILNLNVWNNRKLVIRYGLNLETYEHACLYMSDMRWTEEMFQSALGQNPWFGHGGIKETYDTEEDLELTASAIGVTRCNRKVNRSDIFYELWRKESSYGSRKRILAEERRQKRIKDLMDRVPDLPDDFREWLYGKISEGQEYGFYDKEHGEYVCTACRKRSKKLETEAGKKAVHNGKAVCPSCGRELIVKTRAKQTEKKGHAMLLQVCDDALSTARHFDMTVIWTAERTRIILSESMRVMMFKQNPRNPKQTVDLYYNQYSSGVDILDREWWDNAHNPANRRTFTGNLYPGEEIRDALAGTRFDGWGRLFAEMAASGTQINYNRCMCTGSNQDVIRMIEYLYKGRYYRLMMESAEQISYWSGNYSGTLHPEGNTIKEVFGIRDQQKINRIRENNGGENILEWMRWSDQTGEKIPQETLNWLERENVTAVYVKFIQDRMSLTQAMNYVIRQQGDGYKGKKVRSILSQWEDYLSMCKRQKKDVNDAMIYRPRELKRRHAEIVEEIRKEDMIRRMKADREQKREEAQKMREKYPGAEETLHEIRSRYEYRNEEYMVIVPQNLIEIIMEGNALHHCVGSSERYFERIMRRETYICFLRRVSEPKVPFYTLEVEPGGTIRQHRSMYDEEPGIQEIRGFLREWQQVIKKRLTEEDKRLAGVSRELREKNIEELKAKKNERVLKGLMEDFLEAM